VKNVGTILAALVLAAVLVLYMCTFQVRFTEVAIRKTWGSPAKEAITEPGLYFKWPAPVQNVVKYDQRVRMLEDRTEETRTVDGKNLVLTTFTLWKITDPSTFHTNFPGGEEDGQRKLRTTIVTQKHAVVGRRTFDEFVSTDPKQRKLRDIETEIRSAVASDVEGSSGYGGRVWHQEAGTATVGHQRDLQQHESPRAGKGSTLHRRRRCPGQ
jgi:membrane protease subunit HflC